MKFFNLLVLSVIWSYGQEVPALLKHIDINEAAVASRFLQVWDSRGTLGVQELQHQEGFAGRLRFDTAGKFSISAGIYNGAAFNAGWNRWASTFDNQSGSGRIFLKQLSLNVTPIKGVELDWGSFGVTRGQSTDITSYHGAGYLFGERLVVNRPAQLYLDEVSVTYAYLGDLSKPSVFDRTKRWNQSNYHQFLVAKNLRGGVQLSTDYTFHAGVETLRFGAKVKTPGLKWIDSLQYDNYTRLDVKPSHGFHLGAQKKVSQFTLAGGWIAIDRNYLALNQDAFQIGKRVYGSGTLRIAKGVDLFVLAHRAIANNYAVPNRSFVTFGAGYDLLSALKR